MKKRNLLLLFLFSLFFPTLYHKTTFAEMLGKKLVTSDMHCYINGMPIHCYETDDTDEEIYIIAEDLAKYGFWLYFSYGETGTLHISHYSFDKVYVTTELEDRGKQCFDIYKTDIVTTIGNGIEEKEVKSYNIDGQTAIPISALDCYGNIIYSDDNKNIYFESTPKWNIILPDDHEGDTSQELSHFKIEMTRDEKGEWNITGKNRQYLSAVVIYWEKPTKISIQICIPKTFSEQSEKILKLFENNPDLNSKQKSTQQNIAIANEHTEIYINGEKANITQIKYEGWGSPFNDFWLYLDKDVVSPNDLQSMTIECYTENTIVKEAVKSTYNHDTVTEYTENKKYIEQSTNYDRGYFAEKDNMLYYFKNVGTEQKILPQLFRYDLKKNIETNLSQDIFKNIEGIRVCNDGYVYFKGNSIYNDSQTDNYYRIPANGGKSELVGENIYFLSDTWYYDIEKNAFCNVVTKEIIENTVTQQLQKHYSGAVMQMLERDNIVYISVFDTSDTPELYRQNGEILEKGIYALPLYHQYDFCKIPLNENLDNSFIAQFDVYKNTLYYSMNLFENDKYITSCYKAYSLQNGTTKTILEKENIDIYNFVIYHDTLYYTTNIDFTLYALPLNNIKNAEPSAILKLGKKHEYIHIFENTICHVQTTLLSKIGPMIFVDWQIENHHTGESYAITPYTY